MTIYTAGMTMLVAPNTPEMVEEAKSYCRQMELTQEDAKLGTKDDSVMVILIRDVEYDLDGNRLKEGD